MRLTDRQTAFS